MEEDDCSVREAVNHRPKVEKNIVRPEKTQEQVTASDMSELLNLQAGEGQSSSTYPNRERKAPQYLRDYECHIKSDDLDDMTFDYCYRVICDVPHTVKQAMTSPNSELWARAMDEEMESLKENDTFTLTKLPEGKEVVGGRWVYALKSNADGSEKYKARYVAKGFNQKFGIDYDETFSPTANLTSVRVLMQKAAQENMVLHQMDVKTAYLNAPIDFEIYMKQPEGYEVTSENGDMLVCKLKKSLYGLKQSGRNWNRMLHDFLTENQFVQNPVDYCVYTREMNDQKVFILFWVDDIIIAASNEIVMKDVKEMLAAKFRMKDLGKLRHFIGIDFEQSDHCVTMSQKRYVDRILTKFDMQDCKPRATPCETKLNYTDDCELMTDITKYREAVGSLLYLTTCTRPDLSFIVGKLSQYFSRPSLEQWTTVKHVLRYLKGTSDKQLCYTKGEELGLIAYSDANWAEDASDRRSTSGYCVSLNPEGPLISWRSKKQCTVALSTCEAEYMSLAATIQECLYLVQLLQCIDGFHYTQPRVYEDNQGTIALAKNPVQRQRSKHIDIKYHFVRSNVNDKIILEYCPTEQMVADVMTKPAKHFQLKNFQKFMFGL